MPGRAFAGALVLVIVVATWASYSEPRVESTLLPRQRADAETAAALLGPGQRLWSLGNPAPLVLAGLTNPSRYIYLNSGLDRWAVTHTAGGFDGWTRTISETNPRVVLIGTWEGGYRDPMRGWLQHHYRLIRIGQLVAFVPRGPTPSGAAQAHSALVR
jgi:hypothetical protein